MKRAFIAFILSGLAGSLAFAEVLPPTGEVAAQIAHYRSAVQATLAAMDVSLRELGLRGSALKVGYENKNETESDAFILALILTLVEPVASGVESIEVTGYQGKRRQLEVSVAPQDVRTAYAASLTAEDLQRLAQVKGEVLRAAGLSALSERPLTPPEPPQALPATVAPPAGEAVAAAPGRSDTATTTTPAPDTVAVTAQPPTSIAPPTAPGATPSAVRPAVPLPTATATDLTESQQQQLADALLHALVAARLENISIGVLDQDWVVSFENRTYRSDVDAVGSALRTIAAVLPPVPLALQVTRDDVSVLNLRLHLGDYAALQAELLSPDEMTRRWRVSGVPAGGARKARVLARGNSSLGRVDIALRPAVHYEIGNEADPLIADAFVVGDLDTTVARGWHINLESATRLTSGLDHHLDRALLTKTGWLGREFLATGSVGRFSELLDGWYGELQWQRREHRLGLVGSIAGDDLSLDTDRSQALGYYEYDWGRIGLRARVGYGEFVDNRLRGALLSLRRQFGESVVAAEALRMDDGTEALNARISVPLGPKVADAPSGLRLRSARAFDIGYMSNFGVKGDYLQYGQDLDSFRGELSASYLRDHAGRLLDGSLQSARPRWPGSLTTDGTSGLVRIPTADVVPDGTLLAGVSFMDAAHSRVVTDRTDAMPIMVGVGILPNLELVGKVTVFHDVEAFDWGFNTDRSFNAHYRLWKQKRYVPAVAIGAQDVTFATTTSYLGKAQYIVGTWEGRRWRLHGGLGRDRLDGLFGGMDYDLLGDQRVHLMVDYDTRYVNAGIRGFFGDAVNVDISLLGLGGLSGAVILHRQLR